MINKESNVIENVIVWDGVTEYSQDEKFYLVEINEENVGIGYSYENGIFVEPPPKLEPQPKLETAIDVTNITGEAPNVIA